mgnify:CR=1
MNLYFTSLHLSSVRHQTVASEDFVKIGVRKIQYASDLCCRIYITQSITNDT